MNTSYAWRDWIEVDQRVEKGMERLDRSRPKSRKRYKLLRDNQRRRTFIVIHNESSRRWLGVSQMRQLTGCTDLVFRRNDYVPTANNMKCTRYRHQALDSAAMNINQSH